MSNTQSITLTDKQSRDINLLKGISILLVLFIHANIKDVLPDIDDRSVLGMWTQIVTRILVDNAVPMFFLVSGFLFFLKPGSIFGKWKKRVSTLLMPYILWCLVGFMIPFVFQNVLGLAHLFSGNSLKRIADFVALDYVRIFWDVRDGAPILSTMWFLRNLLVMVALTPVIKVLAIRLRILFPIMLFAIYLFLPFGYPGISSSGLFWFGTGCWLALGGGNLFEWIENQRNAIISAIWCIAFITIVTAFYFDCQYEIIHRLFGIIHFVAIYKCITHFSKKETPRLLVKISTASFFIYAFHEPWMGYILKIIYKMVNPSGIANFIAPFALVVITVAYSYAAYILLKKYAPRLLSLLTGARNK